MAAATDVNPRARCQLCSARKTHAVFCLSLPARNERGESRREGNLIKNASSPQPSPPFLRRRGRENAVALSMQKFCRTQLARCARSAVFRTGLVVILALALLPGCERKVSNEGAKLP